MAISSPLLETSIDGARGILINVTGSMDIGLEEVEQAASLVQASVHPDAVTIFGATFDDTLDDEIRVTVIATGFDEKPKAAAAAAPAAESGKAETAATEETDPQKKFLDGIANQQAETAQENDPFDDILKIFNTDR